MRRIARLLLRIIGWILTPVILICAACIGGTIGTLLAPRFQPITALIVTAALAFLASIAGLWLWIRTLRVSPRLQHALAVNAAGVPAEPGDNADITAAVPHDS